MGYDAMAIQEYDQILDSATAGVCRGSVETMVLPEGHVLVLQAKESGIKRRGLLMHRRWASQLKIIGYNICAIAVEICMRNIACRFISVHASGILDDDEFRCCLFEISDLLPKS